ncbi:hypothetical protein EJB05_17393, partial [Eragrostis curvula]
MGNTVPPRMCREVGTAVVRRHPKNVVVPEAMMAAAHPAAARKQRPRDVEEEEKAHEATRAGSRRGGAVSRAGGGEADTVVTVKIVLKRKDAEALVARLNAQNERERKARLAELKGKFRRVGDGGGGSASPASCRDAWRPRLAPIQEN